MPIKRPLKGSYRALQSPGLREKLSLLDIFRGLRIPGQADFFQFWAMIRVQTAHFAGFLDRPCTENRVIFRVSP